MDSIISMNGQLKSSFLENRSIRPEIEDLLNGMNNGNKLAMMNDYENEQVVRKITDY